ncbi:MAG TPA: CPBP family intramembrane glutamic endopeptidase [Thermoanaerobaculia bacterium]|nr:CPBP family intramembrane glutamic endopeptidase [Thermoanaerobaculia bacterium]
MNAAVFVILFTTGAVLVAGFLLRALRRRGFDQDAFPTETRKTIGLALLVAVLILCVVAPFASGLSGRPAEPKDLSPVSAFALHAVFLLFLIVWYVLSGRPPILDFLKIRSGRPVRLLLAGFPIAAFAWGVSLCGMLAIQWIVSIFAPAGAAPRISPVIPWIVALPLAFKIAIVVSAMIFEEAFFRSFLQPRIGAIGATIFFTLAHGVYGQPVMLVGIFILASILALTFELYGNALPGIVAHGAFDAFELFVLIPFALKFVS